MRKCKLRSVCKKGIVGAMAWFPLAAFAWYGPVVVVKNLTNKMVDYYYSYSTGFFKGRTCEKVTVGPHQTVKKDFSKLRSFEYDSHCKTQGLNQISQTDRPPFDNCNIDVFNVPYELMTTITLSNESGGVRCRYLPHGFGLE